jgi:hypothetical protein
MVVSLIRIFLEGLEKPSARRAGKNKPVARLIPRRRGPILGNTIIAMQQFESLRASSLYCKKCQTAMPVREKLLLVLPDKEIYDYLCSGCASSLGQREVTAGELMMTRAAMARQAASRGMF